jgi:hypothetical protein
LFGKENSVTDLRPTTGNVAKKKSAKQNQPQGFDNIGNHEIENFVALRAEMFSMA